MGFGIQQRTQTEISNILEAALQFDLWEKQSSNRFGLSVYFCLLMKWDMKIRKPCVVTEEESAINQNHFCSCLQRLTAPFSIFTCSYVFSLADIYNLK